MAVGYLNQQVKLSNLRIRALPDLLLVTLKVFGKHLSKE